MTSSAAAAYLESVLDRIIAGSYDDDTYARVSEVRLPICRTSAV